MLNYINSGRVLFGELENGIYDILPHIEPGLMVDCGAAVGGITAKLRQRSPESRVIAFEPFPGNHPHFERRHEADANVTLYKAAVGSARGKASFFTPSVVKSPSRVKSTPGASFVGRLDGSRAPDGAKVIEVDVFTLDEVCDERVRFLKIDVQGGELDTLGGASRLFREEAIDIVYIELMQNPDVLLKLVDLGLILFDSEYTVTPHDHADKAGWRIVREIMISTGQPSFVGWPDHAPHEIERYNRWVVSETDKVGRFTTDLVAIRPDYLPTLLRASAAAIESARGADTGAS